jgi:outer membrane protein TolC
LFDRNQGRIREAQAEMAAAEARARIARNDVQARLKDAYLQLTTALANRRIFQSDILGSADTILKTAESRYGAGDISLSDVLAVRRDCAAVQISYLESLRDVMQAWAEVSAYIKR